LDALHPPQHRWQEVMCRHSACVTAQRSWGALLTRSWRGSRRQDWQCLRGWTTLL
jgi:hypothetical protein